MGRAPHLVGLRPGADADPDGLDIADAVADAGAVADAAPPAQATPPPGPSPVDARVAGAGTYRLRLQLAGEDLTGEQVFVIG